MNRNKGITLISLIVTIVVLIILERVILTKIMKSKEGDENE